MSGQDRNMPLAIELLIQSALRNTAMNQVVQVLLTQCSVVMILAAGDLRLPVDIATDSRLPTLSQ